MHDYLKQEQLDLTTAMRRNYRDLKIAAAIIREAFLYPKEASYRIQEALDLDEELTEIYRKEELEGRGVDFIIGRIRAVGQLEKL